MAQATFNGTVIAESDETVIIEGNHYFPRSSVHDDYLVGSETKSSCPWKGIASYYTVKVGDAEATDGAWFYPTPKDAASEITDHIAFWNGVTVEA